MVSTLRAVRGNVPRTLCTTDLSSVSSKPTTRSNKLVTGNHGGVLYTMGLKYLKSNGGKKGRK